MGIKITTLKPIGPDSSTGQDNLNGIIRQLDAEFHRMRGARALGNNKGLTLHSCFEPVVCEGTALKRIAETSRKYSEWLDCVQRHRLSNITDLAYCEFCGWGNQGRY